VWLWVQQPCGHGPKKGVGSVRGGVGVDKPLFIVSVWCRFLFRLLSVWYFWSPDFGFAFALAQRYDFRSTSPAHRTTTPILTLSVVAFCLV